MFGVLTTPILAETSAKAASTQYITITEENLVDIDQYVLVENNQFILAIPKNVYITDELLSEIANRIDSVNNDINVNSGIINPVTKEIEYFTNSRYVVASAYAAHQVDHFWWGVRHIFRTNSAVNDFTHELDNYALGFTGIGVIAGVLSLGGCEVLSGLTAIYAQKIASDLRYEKSKYSKIEMNITWVLVYRIIQWTD